MQFDDRRHRGRRHHATATASWRRRRSRCAASTTTWRSCDAAKVVLDPGAAQGDHPAPTRSTLAFAQGFELVEDEGLLDEVAGLVEWPVVLMGSFDEAFLEIPAEVIRATIRNNQKCFVVRDPKTGQARQQVHPRRQHRGERRRQGDRRRQRARDPRAAVGREVLLRDRPEDEAGRPAAEVRAASCSTRSSAPRPSASSASCGWRRNSRRWSAPMSRRRSARRSCEGRSADRSGRRVPRAAGPDGQVLRAGAGRGRVGRRGHRGALQAARPERSRADRSGVVAVALADKIDTLVGFWAIDEKPTGSKDPYALRRAALGVIRLIAGERRISLDRVLRTSRRQCNQLA